MEEYIKQTIEKEIKIESGEAIRISVELVNVKRKNYQTIKDFLDTMFKEINELL